VPPLRISFSWESVNDKGDPFPRSGRFAVTAGGHRARKKNSQLRSVEGARELMSLDCRYRGSYLQRERENERERERERERLDLASSCSSCHVKSHPVLLERRRSKSRDRSPDERAGFFLRVPKRGRKKSASREQCECRMFIDASTEISSSGVNAYRTSHIPILTDWKDRQRVA